MGEAVTTAPAAGEALRRPVSVVVVGSLNMDLVVRTPRMPRAGETLEARSFSLFAGGKGANQAVAAARMGAAVAMVGRVGEDAFGDGLLAALRAEEVDVGGVGRTPGMSTGIASIWVDDSGANAIAVVAGANGQLSPRDVERASDLMRAGSLVLLQLEVPRPTVEAAIRLGRERGARVILDPAPAHPAAAAWLEQLWAVTPNQVEAEALVGFPVADVSSGARACRALLQGGVRVAVVKMAEQGAVVAGEGLDGVYHLPAARVEVVDTTAAGDAFAGALAAALAAGASVLEACSRANAAGALAVTRAGAQPSLPRRSEVEAFVAAGRLAPPRRVD